MKRIGVVLLILCVLIVNGCTPVSSGKSDGDSFLDIESSAEMSMYGESEVDVSVMDSPADDSFDENQQAAVFPLQIEKTWFEGERLNHLCSNRQWVVNRYKFASDSDINWLSFFPKEGPWDQPAWQLKPGEGRLIAEVALGDSWMYWIEVPISSLGFVGSGWTLYTMQYQDESSRKVLYTDDTEMQVYPSIAAYKDELYLKFAFNGRQNEIRRYSPAGEELQPLLVLQSDDPGKMAVYGKTLVASDHDGYNCFAVLFDTETGETLSISVPTKSQTERITSLRKAGEWLLYTTVTDSPGNTYAYNMVTGEERVLADLPDACAVAGNRYLLMFYSGQSPILYDLIEDRYYEIPESELFLSGARAEFYGFSEIDEKILIYETSRDVSPALIVELSVDENASAGASEAKSTGESAESGTNVDFCTIEIPETDMIHRYVRGCEAFKDIFSEWDEEFASVVINGTEYPGILRTAFLADEEKNVSFRLVHANETKDGYINELYTYQDGEIVSVSAEPYTLNAETCGTCWATDRDNSRLNFRGKCSFVQYVKRPRLNF